MDIRPIRTEEDHREALREIERLWGSPIGTPDGDKLDVLAILVGVYEDQNFPVEPSSPLDMLRYAVSDMGHTQAELAEVLGSRALASQFLSGSRRISIGAAQKISAAWTIPIQLLISGEPRATHKKVDRSHGSKRKAGDKEAA